MAIVVPVNRGLWRAVPLWFGYMCVATVHLAIGVAMLVNGRDYSIILLYFEPAFVLGQIAFTFESSVKLLGLRLGGGPEARLLVWLIPVIPIAIVLPIEIGLMQDALASWNNQEGQSLKLVYGVRYFLSITLFVVLAAMPVVARLAKRTQGKAVVFHHYLLTAYVTCGALGYICKTNTRGTVDYYLTIAFFILGPLVCFFVWTWRAWRWSPAEFEAVEPAFRQDDGALRRQLAAQVL